jgi:mono/diheme cytochrome c family protein
VGPTSKRDDARDGAQNTAHVVVIMLIVAFGVLALPWMVLRKLDAREQTRGVAASGVPDEDLAQGGKIYYRSCANCHQARGG